MKLNNPLFQKALACQKNKQWADAISHYQRIINKHPHFSPALINLGAVYRQQKQFEQALECFEKAIAVPEVTLEAWYNYGNLCVELKDWHKAQHCFKQVLTLNAHHVKAWHQIASITAAQGQWQAAIDAYQQVIKKAPKADSTYLDLGNAYRHIGDYANAKQCYQKVVTINPKSWKGHYSLARLYHPVKQSQEFEHHYQAALKWVNHPWFIHYNLAQTWFDHADFEAAAQQYELAIEALPEQMAAYIGLGAACMHLQQVNKAKKLFQQVSHSNDLVILNQLARIIWEYKFFDEAIGVLKKMVALRPDLYDTHLNLAKAHSQNWQLSKAIECLQTSLKIKPDCQEAHDLLANIYVKQGRCDESVILYEQQVEREGILSPAVSSFLFTILYSASVTAVEKAEKHKHLMQKWTAKLRDPISFKNQLISDRKIRIGYISADFRDQHPVGLFLQPILHHHDKNQFEIYAYYNTRTYDDSTYVIKAKVDHWFDVAEWTDERLKLQITENQIDILVDLAGHTAKNRLRLFARRAAPIQMSWLGYPHSTGLTTMDYYLADPIICPQHHQHLYAEQVIRFNSHCVFCFPPDNRYGEVDHHKPEQRTKVVLGSFNNLTKVNHTTLHLWLKVMKALPDALLKLKTPSFTDTICLNQVHHFFTENGIAAHRLIFSGPSSLHAMMREYSEIDIALDPIPYNGGTTSMQALWMGVPVVTMYGDNFCGRMSASMLHYLELDDWIANSEQGYIDIIKKKASQRVQLIKLKASLRTRMLESPLCDTIGFTLELEQIYKSLWQHYCKMNPTKS